MSWHLQYASDSQTVVVTTDSHLSDAEAKDLTRQTIALLRRTRATRILNDLRALETAPSLATIYWLVHDFASLSGVSLARIAVLEPKGPQAHEAAQFYTTVCANRRYQAELFTSEQAAHEWLSGAAIQTHTQL